MNRSSRVAASGMGLLVLLSAALSAADPAKKPEAIKPQWQRYLQGADAKQAAEQEKKLVPLQEAGQFAEALHVAEALAKLRIEVQGADHWQVVTSRSKVETLRRLLRQKKEMQKESAACFGMDRDAAAFYSKGRYREAQTIFEKVLAIRRKILGEENAETADSYDNLAESQHEQGKYREAEDGFRKALAIRRKVLGEEHPETASTYSNLGVNLNAQGKYKEAEEANRKALAIHVKVLGEEHPNTAQSHNNLATSLLSQAKYGEAEKSFRQALSIRCKVLGEEHPATATSYNNMGEILNDLGKYKEAEEDLRKALAIYRKVLGEEHPTTAEIYNNVANNLIDQGKVREAEENYRKGLAIKIKVLGEGHPSTAKSYNGLSAVLYEQGKYTEVEALLRKVLAIRRKALGEEHPDTATVYNNLATNLNAQSKYKEAENGYRKALAIRRKALGEEHPDTVANYDSLASHLDNQGKYKEAEELHRKALTIWRKLLGEDHWNTARSYLGLAINQNAQNQYQDAERSLRKALTIYRKVLGEEHPDTALAYNNLALNLKTQGKYPEAEQGFRKALAIWRKMLGEEHRDTAVSYSNLAHNQDAQGHYQEAEQGYRKALTIFCKVLGEGHHHTTTGYTNLGLNLHAQGKYPEAEIFLRRAADSFAKERLHIAASGLERATVSSGRSPLFVLAAVLARNGKPGDAWQRFEESLARGTWDDLTARLRQPPAERAEHARITTRIDRLNLLIGKNDAAKQTPERAKQHEELLSQLRQAYDELADFMQKQEKKYGPVAGQIFPRHRIQAALPPAAALLGWIDTVGEPKAADPNGEHWAVLLRSTGDPIWLRLPGSGDKHAWTEADTQLPGRLRTALQSPSSEWQPLAERLRQQRLQPLMPHLEGVRHLIVLPSTALAGVPIEAITDGHTVSYTHSGTMYAHLRRQPMPTGKGLLALADPVFDVPAVAEKPSPLPPRGVLLTMVAPGSNAFRAGLRPDDVLLRYGETDLAGPVDFKPLPAASDAAKEVPVIVWRDGTIRKRPLYVRPGKLGVAIATQPAPQALAELRRLDRRLASRGGEDGKWDRLPGTRVEVAALQRLFVARPSQVLLDSDASEQRLNELAHSGALATYRYIHLATHGEVKDKFPLRSAVILSRDHLPDDKQRTDLLLAGQPIPDGRLTAEEVLRRWNLNADLVTLSACETALGKYERGEGFVGFAQSLVLSGSRSVCLSLWVVNDTATALLMERFYQNLLGKRQGLDKPMAKAAALAEAKTWLRNLPREEAMRRAASVNAGVDRGKRPQLPTGKGTSAGVAMRSDRPFAHPYYWAAFMLVGQAD